MPQVEGPHPRSTLAPTTGVPSRGIPPLLPGNPSTGSAVPPTQGSPGDQVSRTEDAVIPWGSCEYYSFLLHQA